MLVVAFRSTALAVEQEAPVREGVVGETVGFPTTKLICFLFIEVGGRFIQPYTKPLLLSLSITLYLKMNRLSYTHFCCAPGVIRGKHCACDPSGTPEVGCICLFESTLSSTCDVCYEVCSEFYTLCNIISCSAANQRQTPSTYVEFNGEFDATVRRAVILNKFILNLHALVGSEFVEPTKEERAKRIEMESAIPDDHPRIDLMSDTDDDDETDEEYAMRFRMPLVDDIYQAGDIDQDDLDTAFELQYNEHLRQLAAKHLMMTPPTVDVLTLDTQLPFEPEYYFECINDTYA